MSNSVKHEDTSVLGAIRRLLDGLIAFFQGRGGSTPDERRRLIRVRCAYDVQCESGDHRFPGQVVDIGLNGMKLFLGEQIKTKTQLQIHHPTANLGPDSESVVCHVRWCRKRRNPGDSSLAYEIGVQYCDTQGNMRRSWVKFLLKELGFDERSIFTRRKAVRADSKLPGQLSGDDGRSLVGTVINLGVGGALFEGLQSYPAQSAIRVIIGPLGKFKAIELPGTIITTRRTEDSETFHSSIRFSELSGTQVRYLGDYVIQLLKDRTP